MIRGYSLGRVQSVTFFHPSAKATGNMFGFGLVGRLDIGTLDTVTLVVKQLSNSRGICGLSSKLSFHRFHLTSVVLGLIYTRPTATVTANSSLAYQM